MIQMHSKEGRTVQSIEGSNYSRGKSSIFNMAKEAGIEFVREEKKENENEKNKKFMKTECRYNIDTKIQK